jgi:micrococcal nuclease
MMFKCFISCLTVVFLASNVFNAKVIGITDGDTIVVLTEDKQQVKIRLEGIDCPESKQDFGDRAKQATSDLCFGKMVRIESTGKDRYGRTLAFVYVGKECVNKELLKSGMAWHYKKYNNDSELAKLETEAREQKVGLWAQQDSIATWDFRSNK